MAEENIGSIAVSIVGDYSSLQGDIDAAAQVAQKGGEEIAAALSAGASSADALSGAIATASTGIESFEGQIQALVDSGSTLAEALAAVSTGAAGIGDSMEAAASGMSDVGAAAEAAATGLGDVGAAGESVGTGVEQARDALGRFTSSAGEAGEAAHHAAEGSSELLTTLLEFAGITVSIEALKEFAFAAVESAAEVEKAQIALGYLMGDSEQAAQAIEHLHDVANELALPFESLVGAEQKMTAFGFSAEQTAEAIRAAADAAAAVGSSFDSAAAAIERMALAGTAGSRQLVQLGLSTQDLAATMGVAADEVQKAFKALDESARTDVLVEALQKYQGAAEAAADGTAGAIQRLKNAWAQGMEEIGAALSPVVVAVSDWVKNLDYDFAALIIRVEGLGQSLAHSLLSTKDALTFDFSGATAEFQAAQKADADTTASLATLKQMHDATAQSVDAHTAKTREEVQAEVAAALATGQHADSLDRLYRAFNVGSLDAVSHEAALDDAAEAVAVALSHQQEALEHTQTILHDVIDAYQQGEATAQDVAKALSAVNAAQKAINDTFMAMPDLAAALAPARDQVAQFADSLQSVINAYQEHNATAADVDVALGNLTTALEKVDATMIGLPLSLKTANAELAGMNVILDNLVPGANDVDAALTASQQVLRSMGIAVNDAGDAVSKLIAKYDELAATNPTLQQEEAAWAKISGQVEKLAKTDLPAAIAQYNIHIAQLKQLGASEGELLDAEAKELQIEIHMAEQRGQSAAGYIAQLNEIRARQQALVDSATMWGNAITGATTAMATGFHEANKAIADLLVTGGDWGQSMMKIVNSVAETVSEKLVGAALKGLEDALARALFQTQTLDLAFAKLASRITSLFTGGGGPDAGVNVAGQLAGKAGPDAIGLAGSAGSAGASAAGSASSAAGGATSAAGSAGSTLSSISQISGIVTGAVSAISNVVGNFQQAHMESDLQKIEESTRYLKIYTGEQGDSILATSHDIRDMLSGDVIGDLQSLIEAINGERDLTAQLINTVAGGPTGGGNTDVVNAINAMSTATETALGKIEADLSGGAIGTAITAGLGPLTSSSTLLTTQMNNLLIFQQQEVATLTAINQALVNIPKLDSGTAFVESDMLAYIHQGEAVVPAGGLQTLQSSLASAQSVIATGPASAAVVGVPMDLMTAFPSSDFPGVAERSVESQYTPYMGGVIPGMPSVPQPAAMPSAPAAQPSPSAAVVNHNVFNVVESSDPRETARQIANVLKTLSPRFVTYNQ